MQNKFQFIFIFERKYCWQRKNHGDRSLIFVGYRSPEVNKAVDGSSTNVVHYFLRYAARGEAEALRPRATLRAFIRAPWYEVWVWSWLKYTAAFCLHFSGSRDQRLSSRRSTRPPGHSLRGVRESRIGVAPFSRTSSMNFFRYQPKE